MKAAGLGILVESVTGDAHMAVSPDQFRMVYFQGHPEYFTNSLLKEYKREVTRFINGERQEYPPHPQHYFGTKEATVADNYQQSSIISQKQGNPLPLFPEKQLEMHLDNTWGDTGKALFNNWLGLVYQLTNVDRKLPFIPGINPDDPLSLL